MAQQADGNNAWQQMLANFAMAQNSNPQTLAGFALGKWLNNYIQNGRLREQEEKSKVHDVPSSVSSPAANQVLQSAINNGSTGQLQSGLLGKMGSSQIPDYKNNFLDQEYKNALSQGLTNDDLRKGLGVSYDFSNYNKSYFPMIGG